MMLRSQLLSIVIVLFVQSYSLGQTDLQKAQNLTTCLSGTFPALCHKGWLTSSERQRAAAAERRENLTTCLSGQFPALCNKSLLSPAEVPQVVAAEKRENLRTCLTGQFRALCNKNLLSAAELRRVDVVEKAENLRTCLSGRFPSLCDRTLLTPDQALQAASAERIAASTRATGRSRAYSQTRHAVGSSGCETGHWIESVSDDGEIVKLEDGSVWEVEAGDTVDSALWLPTTDIVSCDDKLINTEDNETVAATRLR